jgi:hypothetical protein
MRNCLAVPVFLLFKPELSASGLLFLLSSSARFFLDLVFYPEDGGGKFLRNVN